MEGNPTVTIFPNGKDYNGEMSQIPWGQDIQRMLGTQKLHLFEKITRFSVRRPSILIPENIENTFFCFFDSNAILLSKNIEKTQKFNKNHQMSPN